MLFVDDQRFGGLDWETFVGRDGPRPTARKEGGVLYLLGTSSRGHFRHDRCLPPRRVPGLVRSLLVRFVVLPFYVLIIEYHSTLSYRRMLSCPWRCCGVQNFCHCRPCIYYLFYDELLYLLLYFPEKSNNLSFGVSFFKCQYFCFRTALNMARCVNTQTNLHRATNTQNKKHN